MGFEKASPNKGKLSPKVIDEVCRHDKSACFDAA